MYICCYTAQCAKALVLKDVGLYKELFSSRLGLPALPMRFHLDWRILQWRLARVPSAAFQSNPQNGNLKCVAAHPEVLGACEVEGPVLLATDPLGNIRSRAGRRSVHQDGQMLGLE